jgi:diadenosine tetraphosphate (Ap4A) HIT family hydrolase
MTNNTHQNTDPYSDEAQLNARFSTQWYDVISKNVTKCPFCDLKNKYFVAEKENVVLTVNTFPYDNGHLLVIPKRHIEKLEEVTSQEAMEMHELTVLGMRVLRQHFLYENLNVLYREGGKNAGQSLKHFHTHILPVDRILKYKQGGFEWDFQKLSQLPIKTAEQLRKLAQNSN